MSPAEQTDPTTLDRIIQVAFKGDPAYYAEFHRALLAVTPSEAEVILRGSAVTGTRWEDGLPFDADGPGTSDLDITFIGGDLIDLWSEFYIPGLHTVPLSEEHPDACPSFLPVRKQLCEIAGRPVNLQASSNLVQYARDVLFEQPYFTLVEKGTGKGPPVDPDPASA